MGTTDPAMLPFDALETSLKTVLLHTGSALSNSTTKDGTKLLSARTQLERNLPDSLKKWHAALDELENQLITTKAALHRDLSALRMSKNAQPAIGTSPAMSLDSDTVMVEAPLVQGTDTEMSGATRAAAERQIATTSPKDQQHDSTTNEVKSSAADLTNQRPDLSGNTNLADKEIILSTTENPAPPTTLDATQPDMGALLPGLMDYADPSNAALGADGASAIGLNLDDFTTNDLFTDTPVGDVPNAVDSIDDLFGEATLGNDTDAFGAAEIVNTEGNGDGAGLLDFDAAFNIDDLLAGDPGTGDGSNSATFDPNFFDDDFFNLGGDGA